VERKVRLWPTAIIMLSLTAVIAVAAAPVTRHLIDWATDAAPCEGSAGAAGWADRVSAAAGRGESQGLRVGVAVVDTATGACHTAGDTNGLFATASVVKVMIAAHLLHTGQLTGDTAALAYSMITRSDDDAADVLWVQAGGVDLEPWIEEHYDLSDLGSANDIPGRWGNTHVTAVGLARLYAALRADPVVWPWLGDAMHHMQVTASDGTDQTFGISAVAPDAAVKQGWGNGSADDPDDAVVNTTGFVDEDRYVVVVLTEGHDNNDTSDTRGFNPAQAATVTAMARDLGPRPTEGSHPEKSARAPDQQGSPPATEQGGPAARLSTTQDAVAGPAGPIQEVWDNAHPADLLRLRQPR
jgi:hypothetical protein